MSECSQNLLFILKVKLKLKQTDRLPSKEIDDTV